MSPIPQEERKYDSSYNKNTVQTTEIFEEEFEENININYLKGFHA